MTILVVIALLECRPDMMFGLLLVVDRLQHIAAETVTSKRCDALRQHYYGTIIPSYKETLGSDVTASIEERAKVT